MLPFRGWLRKRRLGRALQGYPLYDPPHKVEELHLSRESAEENFGYFMSVRFDRLAHLRDWLDRQFGTRISLDESGIRALTLWGNKYSGLLLNARPDGRVTKSYFTYDPPWTGENAGCNVLFDLGIALGEAIIANCPGLHWEVESQSASLPKTARRLKKTPGMSFQRPQISGFDNPTYHATPLHQVYMFAFSMVATTTSAAEINRFRQLPRSARRLILEDLVNFYSYVVKNYPEGDPSGLWRELGNEEYLKIVDEE